MYLNDDKTEKAVLAALENPKYRWRTVRNVAKEVGILPGTVLDVMARNSAIVIKSKVPSASGDDLYTTRDHYLRTATVFEKLSAAFKNRLVD